MPGSMMRPGRSWARRVAELWLLSITKQSSVFVACTNLSQNLESEPGFRKKQSKKFLLRAFGHYGLHTVSFQRFRLYVIHRKKPYPYRYRTSIVTSLQSNDILVVITCIVVGFLPQCARPILLRLRLLRDLRSRTSCAFSRSTSPPLPMENC
jgi:hypothetical protein